MLRCFVCVCLFVCFAAMNYYLIQELVLTSSLTFKLEEIEEILFARLNIET